MTDFGAVADRLSLAFTSDVPNGQATVVGLVKLSIELRRAGVRNEATFSRVKRAIADEISQGHPRSANKAEFDADVRNCLERIFASNKSVGQLPMTSQSLAITALPGTARARCARYVLQPSVMAARHRGEP